jgi:DNA repair photolyase
VWISSVCDPYQPLEEKYKLTRQCLVELAEKPFPLNIQTKSALILRDLDLFLKITQIEVGFTITTDEEKMARLFEPGASSVAERISALEKIHGAGVKTFVFLGPLVPGNPGRLVESLEGKVDKVLIDRMNYIDSLREFYIRHNLDYAMSESFFREHKKRLVAELEKRKMPYEVLF